MILKNPITFKEMQTLNLNHLHLLDIELFVSLNQAKENKKNCLDFIYLLLFLKSLFCL